MLKDDFHAAGIFNDSAPSPHWDKFDLVFLVALTICAILAVAAFAYIVMRFTH
jgi:hypothetical protein